MATVYKKNGFDFIIYHPSFKEQYLRAKGSETYPPFFGSIGHRLRNIISLINNKYEVLYMLKHDEIVGLLSYGRVKFRGIEFHEDDYLVKFIWINPNYRGNKYAELLMEVWLRNIGLSYTCVYETIKEDNYPSLATSKACGYKLLGNGKKNKITGRWKIVDYPTGSVIMRFSDYADEANG